MSDAGFVSNWPLRLWDFTKHHQYIGWSGAYGIGYLAKAYGVAGIGPVENPNDIGPALKRALEIVKRGEPALVDVITQGR